MASAKNATFLEEFKQAYQAKLLLLERALGAGSYFNGGQFCLVDIFYAVIFVRANLVEQHYQLNLYQDLPKVAAWSQALLEHPAVQASIVSDFESLFSEKYFSNK
jgi:glutathione S-transferase